MKNYVWKGETEKATVYEFEVRGGNVVVSSNAANFEDAKIAAGLPKDAKLIRSVSFPIYDGVKNEEKYTDIIWAYKGALPSGKAAIKFLVEKGCLSEEHARMIYGAEDVRL